MATTDPVNPFAAFWKQFEEPLAASSMKMFAETVGKGFPFPLDAFGSPSSELTKATAQVRDLIDAALKLPGAIRPQGAAAPSDAKTAELLQKILDPREWLQATGLVDDSIRRVTEAPKLADLWQMEGKYLALMRAWNDARVLSMEHSRHILGAWAKAVAEFTSTLNGKTGEGDLSSRAELVSLWVETANKYLVEVQASEPYLKTQRELFKTSTDLHLAQRELTEYFSEIFDFPTRTEIDDLTRMMTDLRRELRSSRRSR